MDDRPSITLISQSDITEQTWKVDTSFDISSSDEEKSVVCYADMDVSVTGYGEAGAMLESYTTVSPSSGAETTYAARLLLDSDLDGATIRVQDKNTSYSLVDLANYPINYLALKGAPNPFTYSQIGIYTKEYGSGQNRGSINSIAFHYVDKNTALNKINNEKWFYVNSSGTLTSFTPNLNNETFTPLKILTTN